MTSKMKRRQDGPTEAAQAREALWELLASTLDRTLPMVQRPDRDAEAEEIAALCADIAWLAQTVGRLPEDGPR